MIIYQHSKFYIKRKLNFKKKVEIIVLRFKMATTFLENQWDYADFYLSGGNCTSQATLAKYNHLDAQRGYELATRYVLREKFWLEEFCKRFPASAEKVRKLFTCA
jgi:hypothetical protein